MATRAIPVVSFPNTADSILDYLVQRTDRTIGVRVDQSRLIAVGQVEDTELLNPEPQVDILVTKVLIEKRLTGASKAKHIEIAYAGTAGSGGMVSTPMFQRADRGLFFLRGIPADAPYRRYLPRRAYQLSPGETGPLSFAVTGYDDRGGTFTRDESATVEEIISAIEWYASLSRGKALRNALVTSLDHVNPRIVRHAIRALARQSDASVGQVFRDRLNAAPEDLRARLMLGLWILGDKDSAKRTLEEFFEKHGKYEWLAQWEVQATQVEKGQVVEELYGPDPAEVKGD